MTPPGERSIRNIPLRPTAHPKRPEPVQEIDEYREPSPEREMPRRPRRKRKSRLFWLLALIIIVVCAVGALLLSTVFAGASITVHPRRELTTPPATLEARLNAPVGTLAYETMLIRRGATTTVAASGSARVSRQASGIVTIYNAYGEASQRLIANTRFEAADGKIYRIRDSITVPGATKNADGSLKPGSITATIYADSPGADYNRDAATRFTIPGFRGDPRYEEFYADSQGAISGGFVGNEPAVPAQELAKAEAALKLEIDTAIRAGALAEIPDGYLPVPGTLSVAYSDILKTLEGNTARLTQSAMGTAAIVKESELASAIARASLAGEYGGEAVAFADTTALSIALATSTPSEGPLVLALKGAPTLVWQFDPNALRNALAGKERSALASIIQSFEPAIVQADATIRPFWQGQFPQEVEKIRVGVAQE